MRVLQKQLQVFTKVIHIRPFLIFLTIIPASFFWVKCVRFLPCHDRDFRKRPCDLRRFPTTFLRLPNFAENVRRSSEGVWALPKLLRFRAIYSASKTEKYLLKNRKIGNQLLFSELANIEFTCPVNSNWWLLLPDSNLFLKLQNNFTAEFWAAFSYGLLLQRFFWNSSGIFIISIKADTRNFSKKYQPIFLLDAIFFEQ